MAAAASSGSCLADPDGLFDFADCNTAFGPDTVRIGGFKTNPGIVGDVRLAEISFRAIGGGGQQTTLQVTIVELTDTASTPLSFDVFNGVVTIVPFGDANLDGATTMVDALVIAQVVMGLLPPSVICEECADVDEDSSVTMVDALLIAQCVLGLVDGLPPPGPFSATCPP